MTEPYEHRGGSGEPLVLIHGFSGTWRVWLPVLDELERHHDVLAVGLAGHFGCPALPDGVAPSPGALFDALEADLDRHDIQTAHLVGNSLGGWAALELARRGRARSVVALAPAGGWEPGSADERRLRRFFLRQYRVGKASLPIVERLMRSPRRRRWALRDVARHGDRIPAGEATAMARASVGCPLYKPLLAALPSHPLTELDGIGVPVTIAWSEHDRILRPPGCTERFRALVPDARWTTIPDAGHVPMADAPGEVVRTILEVTGGAAAAAPGAAPAAADQS